MSDVCLAVCLTCPCRERGRPYLLYVALAHMHVPLAPRLSPDKSSVPCSQRDGGKVYAASLQEMDGLVGAIKSASDAAARDNTLIWFTGLSATRATRDGT